MVRRRKKSDEIEERVLERQGFVNKIIIKGITTSLFLKEEANLSHVSKQEDKPKNNNPELMYSIYTSNSIKEINEEMKYIQEKYKAPSISGNKGEICLR